MIYGDYEGRVLHVRSDGSEKRAEIKVRGYAKKWTVTVIDGFYEVDEFHVSGNKYAVKNAVKKRGWLD